MYKPNCKQKMHRVISPPAPPPPACYDILKLN